MTNIKNTFVIGNSVFIFDLVDRAMISSLNVLDYILKNKSGFRIKVLSGKLIKNYIPQIIENDGSDVKIYFRVKKPVFNKEIVFREDERVILNKKIKAIYPAEIQEISFNTNLIEKDEVILEIK